MARKLSHDFKLAARTAPEIYEVVNHLVLRAGADGLKFRRRKVGVEAAVNAILVDFLDKTEPERMALLFRNVPRFELMLDAETEKLPDATAHVNNTRVLTAEKKTNRRGS